MKKTAEGPGLPKLEPKLAGDEKVVKGEGKAGEMVEKKVRHKDILILQESR